jgi:hypothetical protein
MRRSAAGRWIIRVAAAEKKGETRINSIIRPGTLPQAQFYSFGVNKTHGLRRTNDDKSRAVKATLEHALSNDWSDNAIAEHCGVDQKMVSRMRATLTSVGALPQLNTRTGKDGKSYPAKKPTTKTTTSETTTNKTGVETPVEESFEEHEEVQVVEPVAEG